MDVINEEDDNYFITLDINYVNDIGLCRAVARIYFWGGGKIAEKKIVAREKARRRRKNFFGTVDCNLFGNSFLNF
jgi:hypothetical protein